MKRILFMSLICLQSNLLFCAQTNSNSYQFRLANFSSELNVPVVGSMYLEQSGQLYPWRVHEPYFVTVLTLVDPLLARISCAFRDEAWKNNSIFVISIPYLISQYQSNVAYDITGQSLGRYYNDPYNSVNSKTYIR